MELCRTAKVPKGHDLLFMTLQASVVVKRRYLIAARTHYTGRGLTTMA